MMAALSGRLAVAVSRGSAGAAEAATAFGAGLVGVVECRATRTTR
jgi:hypothetical protein